MDGRWLGIFTISDGMPFTPLISGDAVGENSSGSL